MICATDYQASGRSEQDVPGCSPESAECHTAAMDLERHLAGSLMAEDALAGDARVAELAAPVPTTPGRDVRRLLAHPGRVHRWATATIGWLREGCGRLVAAASLGPRPRSADTPIGDGHALDGIDELLTGFLPQRRSRLRSPEPICVAVSPDDSDLRWRVTVSDDPPVTQRGRGDEDSEVVLRGSAGALYLTLWNRSHQVTADGFHLWAERVRV